jgi:AcrR family transcriptional regulator
MPDTPLTRDVILETAEDCLRRFGPDKAAVIDVARALHVSHGSVYRHFASKADLRDAVVARWLERVSTPLQAIVKERTPALPRLRRWLDQLIASNRQRAQDDPQLFATYVQMASSGRQVVTVHANELVRQLTEIVEFGINAGDITDRPEAPAAARALFEATARFHHPALLLERSPAEADEALDLVWDLLMTGLVDPEQAPPRPRFRRGLPPHKRTS